MSSSSAAGSAPKPVSSGWKKAAKVLTLVKASQGFETLRDMISEEAIVDRDRLELKSPLGEGAFAHVILATLDGERPVAVKSLKPELLKDPAEIRLFLSENAVLRKIRHPHIIELIGVGGAKDPAGAFRELFIVQEFCPGGSLRDIVFQQMITPRKSLYSASDALRWCLQVAKALAYLHAASPKVIHRDLKLDNILLDSKDVGASAAKLADFGLATLVKKHTLPTPALQKQL